MIPAVETRGLTHRYGRTVALRELDLEVPTGSLYALLGPNGAGKSTLLQIVLGLLAPTSGAASVRGVPAASLTALDRRRIGYVAEGQRLPGWMTVSRLQAWLAPLYDRWDHALAGILQERFRLDPGRKIRHLSRGERMKAALLAALAPRPEVLVMDEPFSGMDAVVKDEVAYGLLELALGSGCTVLVCSHDIGELEPLADHVGILDRGRLVIDEPLEVLLDRFKRVEVRLADGALTEMSGLPPTWLVPRRAGKLLTFVTCEHGVEGWEADIRANLPGSEHVAARPASLREVFVAVASDGTEPARAAAAGGAP